MSVATIWANDLRSMTRDRTIAFLLAVPWILALFLRFAMPVAERHIPLLGDHRSLLLAFFCMIAGTFPAFMASFVMLDERDEGLFEVWRILPLPPRKLLLARLALVAGLSFLFPLVLMALSGLGAYSPSAMLALAGVCALIAPTATLIVVSTAANKIEGLTLIKGLFFPMALPLWAFVAPAGWTIVFAALPTYWLFLAFTAPGPADLLQAAAGGFLVHAAYIAFFYRRFRRRVFP